jgi:hypothetical protein
MKQAMIFAPMFALMGLTFVVWVYLYARRLPFIRSLDGGPEQFAPAEFARLSPPAVSNPSDNFKNLFELPVLFYGLAGYLFVTQSVDQVYLTAAWVFVLFRVLHSAVHCTVNIVVLRFGLYLMASLALWFMLGRAILQFM